MTVSASVVPSSPIRLSSRFIDRKSLLALLVLIPPALLLYLLFVIWPMIDAARFSVYDWSGYGPMTDFVGLENFETVLKHRHFATAVRNSAFAVLVSLLVQLPLAMWVALALANKGWAVNALRVLFFVPYMLAEIAAGLIWSYVYDGNNGLTAVLGRSLNIHLPFLLGDPVWVMPAIMVVVVWKYFGFHMMVYIAGLQSISREVIEAAQLDGVKRWQIAVYIKIPMIWSAIVVTMFFAIIGSIQLFDLIVPLSNGGPNNASNTVVTYLYQFALVRRQLGIGGAMGVMLFLVCLAVTIGYRKLLFNNESA